MIAVVPGRNGDPAHWRLICRGEHGADVLAMAPISTPSGGWQAAVACLRDGAGELQILGTPDGHFQWTLTSSAGAVIARSPAIHRDAAACRRAFVLAQRVARTVLGAAVPR